MDNITIVISLIYYMGIASCAVQGAEKGKHDNSIPILRYISNAFGGGFARDLIFLGVHPWLLTLSALPDLIFVIVTGFWYTYHFYILKVSKKYYTITIKAVTITDALGAGSFVYKGMEQAFIYSENIFIIIVCGYVTAIGGGLLASGKSLKECFKSKKVAYYHIIILLGCCYYYTYRDSIRLVIFIAIGLFLVNANYKDLYNFYLVDLISPRYKVYILYSDAYNNRSQRQKIINVGKKSQVCPEQVRIYIMQHRIRQC